jgi:hypothetical protein
VTAPLLLDVRCFLLMVSRLQGLCCKNAKRKTMMGHSPRATNSATTARKWRAATSVASSVEATRAVSST